MPQLDMLLLLLVTCLVSIGHVCFAGLTIGAFNIQRLSDNKVNDPTVLKEIAQILVRYDIASIEEVLHPTAIQEVMDEVNRLGGPYSITMSSAMGRTSYKEHLAIIYRSDKVTLRKAVQYQDTSADAFEREPYSALFHSTLTSVTDFAIMGVHLKPTDAYNEMNALVHAYDLASQSFGTQNFLIVGDFNADCRYLSTTQYHNSKFWTDDRFYFLVNAAADTTASHNTNCAYDRFVAAGAMKSGVVAGSVQVYNFETGLHLSYDQARHVSDHYPIQLQMA